MVLLTHASLTDIGAAPGSLFLAILERSFLRTVSFARLIPSVGLRDIP